MSTMISVEGVSKKYRLGLIGGGTLKDDLNRWWARVRRKPDPRLKIGQEHLAERMGEEFWALKDVSFEVEQGEVLGIIGRNGAGKSTLLKVLSRVTAPTTGRIRLAGRVASLLEVGTGFHPELTGRENTYLNGAILGMTKREIDRKFDEIVAFSEVEQFIDTPVKRYSSGMYVRLAFAVAAHLDPEILIVDEVLAVGDAAFQKKCLGKMGDVAKGGRTVLFVSHSMAAIASLCSLAVVVVQGRCAEPELPSCALARYLASTPPRSHETRGRYITKVELISCGAQSDAIQCGDGLVVVVRLGDTHGLGELHCAVLVLDADGARVVVFQNSMHSSLRLTGGPAQTIACEVGSLPLVPGSYTVELKLSGPAGAIETVERAANLTIHAADLLGTGKTPVRGQGYIVLPSNWRQVV